MALANNVYKSQQAISRYIAFVITCKLKYCIRNHGSKAIALDNDVLDDFTTQLMQKKLHKWDVLQSKNKLLNPQIHNVRANENGICIKYLKPSELDLLLKDSVEENNDSNVKAIVGQCIEYKRLPTLSVFLQTLSFFSHRGDREEVITLRNLYKEIEMKIAEDYSNFNHFLAEATWIKGNINESISLFEEVYRKNVYLRRRIRLMLKYLISDAISNRSEAALINIINFANRLLADYKDFYPLACVWQTCFLSEWFTDQSTAINMLRENEGVLLKTVGNQLPYVVAVALRNHQTEVVHRLLEVLLEFKQVALYTMVLKALFSYRLHQGDLRSCSEIIKWSFEQGVDLPAIQQENFVKLFTLGAITPHVNETIHKVKSPKNHSYHLRF